MILEKIKYFLFFILTFILGTQVTYAKTEFVLPQNQVVFSIEKQSFKNLEKEVKGNNSTFFSDSWNEEKVLYEISYAFENKQLVPSSTNKYRGTSASGIQIEMYINNGVIKTAYP